MEVLVDKLARLQNICIHYIYGLRKFDHISKSRAQLKWLTIRQFRNVYIICLLYNILLNPAFPVYLCDSFNYVHRLDSSCRCNVSNLLPLPSHSKFFFKLFYCPGCKTQDSIATSNSPGPINKL